MIKKEKSSFLRGLFRLTTNAWVSLSQRKEWKGIRSIGMEAKTLMQGEERRTEY